MVLRNFLILLIFISLIPDVSAITQYEVDIIGNSALINVTFELYTDNATEKVNYWRTTFILPKNSEIVSIRDSIGEIDKYNLSGSNLIFETNKGSTKNKEVVSIFLKSLNIVNKEYYPLKIINFSFSGFSDKIPDVPDELTFVELETDERIISESHSFGFIFQVDGNKIKYQGEGPINFNILYSDSGEEHEHYILFGNMNITRADEMYGMIVAVTGIPSPFDKFPVVILDDDIYEKKINDWSMGEYSNGLIFIKKSESVRDTGTATLLHETTHGFNEEALRWSKLEISWFDEGVAKYVEFLANKNLGVRQAEIFGEPIKWREGKVLYVLNPRQTPDDLWDYYQTNQDFMKTWNTGISSLRAFGYAFSELLIREHILKNGPEGLYPVYQTLLAVKNIVEDTEEYNNIILSALNSDMKPCYSENREIFEFCLDKLNEMEPEIPKTIEIEGKKENITIIPIELPEQEPKDFFGYIWKVILDFIDWLDYWIGSLFAG